MDIEALRRAALGEGILLRGSHRGSHEVSFGGVSGIWSCERARSESGVGGAPGFGARFVGDDISPVAVLVGDVGYGPGATIAQGERVAAGDASRAVTGFLVAVRTVEVVGVVREGVWRGYLEFLSNQLAAHRKDTASQNDDG